MRSTLNKIGQMYDDNNIILLWKIANVPSMLRLAPKMFVDIHM